MKLLQTVLILCVMLSSLILAKNVDDQSNFEIVHISAETLKQELDEQHGVLLLNVLNKHTAKDCSIQGSLLVPVQHLSKYVQKKVRKGKWFKDQEIVIYCASADCPLSRHAYKILQSIGFSNVKLLRGGIRDWKQKGYPCKGKGRAGYLKG